MTQGKKAQVELTNKMAYETLHVLEQRLGRPPHRIVIVSGGEEITLANIVRSTVESVNEFWFGVARRLSEAGHSHENGGEVRPPAE